MPSRAELVAHGRTMEDVAEPIGADLAQLGIQGLVSICSGRVLDAWRDVSIR
jgi:glutamine phosphoribosylpyrophosphate amidotransferase